MRTGARPKKGHFNGRRSQKKHGGEDYAGEFIRGGIFSALENACVSPHLLPAENRRAVESAVENTQPAVSDPETGTIE